MLRRGPDEPTHRMLAGVFGDQAVEVTARDLSDGDGVALIEDGEVVAVSPMSHLERATLFVSSDLYTTGTRPLGEADLPDVLTGPADARFALRGYPLAHKEKLLTIAVARQIELLAHRAGAGTLRASFQRLSRIDDERGTRRAYDALCATDLAVHLYGEPDADPADRLPVAVPEGYGDGYTDSWFVVFRPADGAVRVRNLAADLGGALDPPPRRGRGSRPDDQRVAVARRVSNRKV